ncbi:MAG: twitching motility protein PilT [Egibacteraceae bacterium]
MPLSGLLDVAGLIYDTGALIAAEAGDATMWRMHRAALEAPPVVPASVIAQAWRNGAKQALLARFLHGCDRVDFTSHEAYAVGELLAVAGTTDVVDAAVVLLTARRGDIVVTSDAQDLTHLAAALGIRIVSRAI